MGSLDVGAPRTAEGKGTIQNTRGNESTHNVWLGLPVLFLGLSLSRKKLEKLMGECDQSRGKT